MGLSSVSARLVTAFFTRRFHTSLIFALMVGLVVAGLNLGLSVRPAKAVGLFTVTLNTDSGIPGELRDAINNINATPGGGTIDFSIGTGLQTIALASPLPAFTQPVTIDGTTQPGGATCGPAFTLLIEITAGGSFGATGNGLVFSPGSEGSVVTGLVVNNFPDNGISLDNGGSNSVTCSFLGTDTTGTVARPNGTSGGGRGIQIINSSNALNQNNVIGGTTAGARNIISGNKWEGVAIIGNAAGVNNNTVEGNYIGTDVTGTLALANGTSGVALFGSLLGNVATGNVIGGAAPGARNIISGNTSVSGAGVVIDCVACTNNLVEGNYIGTTVSGLLPLGNSSGIAIYGGSLNNTVKANTVSGNVTAGVNVSGAGTNGNTFTGNFIGTNPTGTAAVPNGSYGLAISGGAQNNTVQANVVSGNTTSGVGASGAGTNGNTITGNFIGTNLTGTAAIPNGSFGLGVFLGAQNNTINANVISGNGASGASVNDPGSNGNIFTGNFIGTNATGTATIPNGTYGFAIFNGAQNNRLGGTTPAERNVISGNTQQGVAIDNLGTSNNVVEGNYIGCDATGTIAFGNNVGINIFSGATNNTVGGVVAGARNLISGNQSNGVGIAQTGTTNNIVIGNYIGVNASGTAALANTGSDVAISVGAANNRIGGTTPAERNIIGGSLASGVRIHDAGSSGNIIEGNYIGTNASGTAAIANAAYGVDVYNGATNNIVGGTAAGASNLISGSALDGIHISDPGTSGNSVFGNLIGTNASGSAALPNGGNGVLVQLTASGNAIGGTAAGQANVIDYNTGAGVSTIAGLFGNPVRGNSIYQNGGLGISALGNVPVFTSSGVVGGSYQISGTLTGTPSATYVVDFYSSTVGDPSGSGEGQTYLGAVTVVIPAGGTATFGPATFPIVAGQPVLSATATDSSGNTSQFSINATVVLPIVVAPVASGNTSGSLSPLLLTLASPQQIVIPGDSMPITVSLTNISGASLNNVVVIVQVATPLVISSPVPNCRQIVFNVGTVQPNQQVLLNVLASVPHVVASATAADSAPGSQFVSDVFARNPKFSPQSVAAARAQTIVNVAQASWDDQNVATASQIITLMPNATLPGTGEHPAESTPTPLPEMAAFAVGIFGLFGFALLAVTRTRRARSR